MTSQSLALPRPSNTATNNHTLAHEKVSRDDDVTREVTWAIHSYLIRIDNSDFLIFCFGVDLDHCLE